MVTNYNSIFDKYPISTYIRSNSMFNDDDRNPHIYIVGIPHKYVIGSII